MQGTCPATPDCMRYALQEPPDPLLQPGHQPPEEEGLQLAIMPQQAAADVRHRSLMQGPRSVACAWDYMP